MLKSSVTIKGQPDSKKSAKNDTLDVEGGLFIIKFLSCSFPDLHDLSCAFCPENSFRGILSGGLCPGDFVWGIFLQGVLF